MEGFLRGFVSSCDWVGARTEMFQPIHTQTEVILGEYARPGEIYAKLFNCFARIQARYAQVIASSVDKWLLHWEGLTLPICTISSMQDP